MQAIRITLHAAAAVHNNGTIPATSMVPTAPIAIPADTGRKGLSAVVRHLLLVSQQNDTDNAADAAATTTTSQQQQQQYEFIVGRSSSSSSSSTANNNRLLRTSLEREVRRCQLSTEDAIPVTYFRAQPVPQQDDTTTTDPLDDWVGALSYNNNTNTVVAGCYDGLSLIHI